MDLANLPSSNPAQAGTRYWSYRHPKPPPQTNRLVATDLDDLSTVIHHGFGGRRDPAVGFRCLVVGDTTGDATLFLAHQLAQAPSAEVTYLHHEPEAFAHVRRRATDQGLSERIRWIEGSAADLPRLCLEPADYIHSADVLARTENPQATLKLLLPALSQQGVVSMALPGEVAHLGVGQVREMLQILRHVEGRFDRGEAAGLSPVATPEGRLRFCSAEEDASTTTSETSLARNLVSGLVPTNWHHRAVDLFLPHDAMGDDELASLLLQAPFHTFTIDRIHELLASAGLHLVQFSRTYRMLYDPVFTFRSERVLERLAALERADQQAACELCWGAIRTHRLWASRRQQTAASVTDLDLAPRLTFVGRAAGVAESIERETRTHWKLDLPLPGNLKISAVLPANSVVKALVQHIDGRRTSRQILDAVVGLWQAGKLVAPEDSPTGSLVDTFFLVLETLTRFDLVALGLPSNKPD